MKIILISGKARHGKDTVANIIKDKLELQGDRVLLTHYGDLLKYICKTFFGWNGEKDVRGRYILQHVGTDIVRKQNPNYWVDFIINILKLFPDEWDYVIIPDCRFPNEISRLSELGCEITHLRVKRQGFDSELPQGQQNHSSETALDDIKPDFYINNVEGLDNLNNAINSAWFLIKE